MSLFGHSKCQNTPKNSFIHAMSGEKLHTKWGRNVFSMCLYKVMKRELHTDYILKCIRRAFSMYFRFIFKIKLLRNIKYGCSMNRFVFLLFYLSCSASFFRASRRIPASSKRRISSSVSGIIEGIAVGLPFSSRATNVM